MAPSIGEKSAGNPLPLSIHVTFSRPTYRLGGTIVGTIRIPSSDVLLKSLQLSAVGLCRLDPRWHRSSRFAEATVLTEDSIPDDFVLPPHTIPFWTAGSTIELMELPGRAYGAWENVRPTKPIRLQPSMVVRFDSITSVPTIDDATHLDPGQLLFTFRVSLPSESKDHPHSFQGTSCRYYYCILLRILTMDASHPEWLVRPVTVLPSLPNVANPTRDATPPPFQVMAHSTGLPTRISATELQPFEGQYTVVSGVGGSTALYRNARTAQSMRVVDPTSQRPVAVLTILGNPSELHPGVRLTFCLDFSGRHADTSSWIPCHQVSACLQGQEMVLGDAAPRVARRYIWNTDHEVVDPDTTDILSLSLLVPVSVPCSIEAPHVALQVQCLLDLAVGTPHAKTGAMEYRNVHLELPCQIRPPRREWECDASATSDLHHTLPALYESIRHLDRGTEDAGHSAEFATSDISSDLKLLSFQMAKACGLQPKPRNS